MAEKTKYQLQEELNALKAKLAEKPAIDESVVDENEKLKEELNELKAQKGLVKVKIDPEVEKTTYIYKATYPHKVKVCKAITKMFSDGIGGYVREKVKDAIFTTFKAGFGGGYFTLNKSSANAVGLTVSEYKKYLEESSQFNDEFELLISSKDGKEIEKFRSKLSPKKVPLISGVVGV